MQVVARTLATMRVEMRCDLQNPNITMDEFEGRLRAQGHVIVRRDDTARSITIKFAQGTKVLEAGTFIPDVEAVQAGLLPADTALVPCTADGCRQGTAFRACTAPGCTNGHLPDGSTCTNCDGGGNELGGPCPTCGGYGQVAKGA